MIGQIRSCPNYSCRRIAVSLQYHGSSFLGFTSHGEAGENCITPTGVDLRGHFSVEGRLRKALSALLMDGDCSESSDRSSFRGSIVVSSRTDQGVHAIKNTCHIDFADPSDCLGGVQDRARNLTCSQIRLGLNYFLARQARDARSASARRTRWLCWRDEGEQVSQKRRHLREKNQPDDIRILNVVEAPSTMPEWAGRSPASRQDLRWHARYSAVERTYAYRIHHGLSDWMRPFEWDRSWYSYSSAPLDVAAMRQAASLLQGTHDFSAFRNRGCQRASPIVHLKHIQIYDHPFSPIFPQDHLSMPENFAVPAASTIPLLLPSSQQTITIVYQGNSFLYRQVRNMTGCLMAVGNGRLSPKDVQTILDSADRSKASYKTAPAHGLFLIDVKHMGIDL